MPQINDSDLRKSNARDSRIHTARHGTSAPAPISLEKIGATGEDVTIGAPIEVLQSIGPRTYTLAAYPVLRVLGRAQKAIGRLPEAWRMHALAAALADSDYDTEATAGLMRRMSELGNKGQQHTASVVRAVTDAVNAGRTASGLDAIPYPEGVILPDDDTSGMTTDTMAMAIYSVECDDDQTEAMVDVVHLAVLRRHPNVKREEIEAELDLPAFMDCLKVVFRLNDGVRQRFTRPQSG